MISSETRWPQITLPILSNLWGENQKLFTIDVIVFGDTRELEMLLHSTFPNAALKVVPVGNSVMVSGFVDQPERIERIVRIAEEYYPKVINNMTVGGVQTVLLHVKVMEVNTEPAMGTTFSVALGNVDRNINSSSLASPTSRPGAPRVPISPRAER